MTVTPYGNRRFGVGRPARYARGVDWGTVVRLGMLAVLLLLPLVRIVPTAWRTFVRNEEPEAGGSLGRQVLGRTTRRR